jgi:hypothetical protein
MPLKVALRRASIAFILGLLIGLAISEISFLYLHETARPPSRIQLVIPAGTAAQVERGEKPPSIPDSLSFVVGDTLVVKNEDSSDHQLGPLWIPAGSSASLKLDQVEKYAFTCSFQPTKYFGLDVNEPLTPLTRMEGILFAGIPMGALLAVYSLVAWPVKKQEALA